MNWDKKTLRISSKFKAEIWGEVESKDLFLENIVDTEVGGREELHSSKNFDFPSLQQTCATSLCFSMEQRDPRMQGRVAVIYFGLAWVFSPETQLQEPWSSELWGTFKVWYLERSDWTMGLPLLEGWMLSSQIRFARVCSRKNGLLHSTVNPHTWSSALMAIFLPSSLPCCNMLQADGATQTWAKAAPTEQNISLFFMKHPVLCILLQQHKVNWGRLSLMFPVKTVLHMVLRQLCHAGHLWFLLVHCVFGEKKLLCLLFYWIFGSCT